VKGSVTGSVEPCNKGTSKTRSRSFDRMECLCFLEGVEWQADRDGDRVAGIVCWGVG
jgi:hypothetical protein